MLFAFFRCCFFVVDLTLSGAEKPNPDPPNQPCICLIGEHPDRLLDTHSSQVHV